MCSYASLKKHCSAKKHTHDMAQKRGACGLFLQVCLLYGTHFTENFKVQFTNKLGSYFIFFVGRNLVEEHGPTNSNKLMSKVGLFMTCHCT